jgi:predicted transcriptional regulator of viral defense system
MEFEHLIEIVQDEPVFETGLLLAGDVDPNHIRRQLTRWTNAGKIYQLRRGLYALAPPYQKVKPHPFSVANRMVPGSYVSCQSALGHYGLIPEYVPTVVSVCSSRPRTWDTPLGTFLFRHVRRKYLFGYRLIELGEKQQALIAGPEKALLDLIYLTTGGDSEEYIRSLRLQHLEQLDVGALEDTADEFGKPKLSRAAKQVASVLKEAAAEEERR